MSGIAGIVFRDGRPIAHDLLRCMLDVASHRGPDGSGIWADGSVGLGHLMLHTTQESLRERQPLHDAAAGLTLTFDGRVDNREELRAALVSRGFTPRDETDAELVLRAYQCWGEHGPARIIGDFALAIWDARNHRLFCARDPVGVRPLYFHISNTQIVFASELRQILEVPSVPREPNEGMVAEYLAAAVTTNDETLYQGIARLPAGHFLIADAKGVRIARYWEVNPNKRLDYKTDDEYAEHFRHLLDEAVRSRLRSHLPVAAELSGGVDSSSIVCTTHRLLSEGRVAAPGFATYSLVYPGMPCDESRYVDDVAQMWDVTSHRFCPREADAAYYAACVSESWDIPDFPNQSNSDDLTRAVSRAGHRVLLTGQGGDDWLSGSIYHYADLLRGLRLAAFVHEVRQGAASITSTGLRERILRYGLMPLLPKEIRRVIRRVRNNGPIPAWPYWMPESFTTRTRLAERLGRMGSGPGFRNLAQRDTYHNNLTNGRALLSHEMRDRFYARRQVEIRHPLHDRRIIEFALAIPEEQRWRDGVTKFVLRRAMRGTLPESVRQRSDKSEFSHHFAQSFRLQGGSRLFSEMAISTRGWVDQWEVDYKYARFERQHQVGDTLYGMHIWPLWNIFGIDLWYKTMFGRSGRVVYSDDQSLSLGMAAH